MFLVTEAMNRGVSRVGMLTDRQHFSLTFQSDLDPAISGPKLHFPVCLHQNIVLGLASDIFIVNYEVQTSHVSVAVPSPWPWHALDYR